MNFHQWSNRNFLNYITSCSSYGNRFEHRDALTGVERFNRDSINWKDCLHSSSKNYQRQKIFLKHDSTRIQ